MTCLCVSCDAALRWQQCDDNNAPRAPHGSNPPAVLPLSSAHCAVPAMPQRKRVTSQQQRVTSQQQRGTSQEQQKASWARLCNNMTRDDTQYRVMSQPRTAIA